CMAFAEGGRACAEWQKKSERQQGGAAMIEHDVSDPGHAAMAGDDRRRNLRDKGQLGGIDCNDALDQSIHEEPRILLKQVRLMAMADDKIKVAGLEQIVLDPGQH